MNSGKTKILFVSHDANYSGAPIILLNTIKWLSSNSDFELAVLFQKNGELIDEFTKYVKIIYKYFNIRNNNKKILNRIYNKYVYPFNLKKILASVYKENYDIIFANSIACNYFIKNYDNRGNAKIITNVLELEYTFHSFKIDRNSAIMENSDLFICMNKSVSENLVANHNIDQKKIKTINSITGYVTNKSNKKELLKKIGVPENSIIIGASGTVEWRKGSDLFIQLALIYRNKYGLDNLYFVWAGKFSSGIEKYNIIHDIEKAGLQGKVLFVGEITEVNDYYSAFDIFTLMSREEALGIVCIENMALGNPIICFEKCGGMEDVADTGAAIKVPYLNIESMSDEIHKLILDKEHYNLLSKKSTDYVNKEFNNNVLGKKYLEVFDKMLYNR